MVGDGVKDKDGVGAEEEIGGVVDMKRGGGHILSGRFGRFSVGGSERTERKQDSRTIKKEKARTNCQERQYIKCIVRNASVRTLNLERDKGGGCYP